MNPTNQASRKSFVVPVFPAASSLKPDARTAAPELADEALRVANWELSGLAPGIRQTVDGYR